MMDVKLSDGRICNKRAKAHSLAAAKAEIARRGGVFGTAFQDPASDALIVYWFQPTEARADGDA